jgi:protein-disulfide isomerase
LYFAFILGLIALCRRSTAARQNLPGYVFAMATVGLAAVLYLAYASFVVLKAVCLLCVGTYAAIIALFLLSGAAARYPMSTLPGRASGDMRRLIRTPAALSAALAFVGAAIAAVLLFPGEPISASSDTQATPAPAQAAKPAPAAPAGALQQLETWLKTQPRVPIVAAGASGAAVVIIKFNDYQCPPCGATFKEYKPILAKLQQEHPGKIAFITRDFPLDPECNTSGGPHQAGCEAAVAVRLAREKGRADVMEDWLFANQASLTPASVRQNVATVGGVTDFEARYATTLELVKGDIAQGRQLGVSGTPTFFMNGIRLPTLRGQFFEAAVNWELRQVAGAAR